MIFFLYLIFFSINSKQDLQKKLNKYYNDQFSNIKKTIKLLIKEEKYEEAIEEINNYINKNFLINNDYLFELKILELECLFLNKSEELNNKIEIFQIYFLERMSHKNQILFFKYYFLFKYYTMYAQNKVNKDEINILLDINEEYFIYQKYTSVGKEEEIDKMIQKKIENLKRDKLNLLLKDILNFEYEVDFLFILLNKNNETEAFEKYNVLYQYLLNTVQENGIFDADLISKIAKKIKK